MGHRLSRKVWLSWASVLITAVLTVVGLALRSSAAPAAPETVLYSFNYGDGATPQASLITDAVGNLYGTTVKGGADRGGTVFELIPNAAKTTWTETVLYSFCKPPHRCTDGTSPTGGLLMDGSGNLYGTTWGGGAYGGGTVFELIPDAAKTTWTETVLYNFCAQTDCVDGYSPSGGLIIDSSGNLYGTSMGGAYRSRAEAPGGGGAVFELTPPGPGQTEWIETVLYSFCAQSRCIDGATPEAGLIMDLAGDLYGTTVKGGARKHGGTVFELTPDAAKTTWTERVLYNFCPEGDCIGTNGAYPTASLIMDTAGNLYGTTSRGGANCVDVDGGCGTVFELIPNASKTKWKQTVLYSFCAHGLPDCSDGADPEAGLIMDGSGNLYGTTPVGGTARKPRGTVFELTQPTADQTEWTETVLYSFCAQPDCADGEYPVAGLIIDDHNLYGTTSAGGAYCQSQGGCGVVFGLKP